MKKEFFILFFVFFVGVQYIEPLQAHAVSSIDLINNVKDYDGKTVIYEGEVIGDIMPRKDFTWINLNDGNNAIGIFLNKGLIKGLLYFGSHQYKGDWVRVEGVFNRSCIEHGGDLDIHATQLIILKHGRRLKDRPSDGKKGMAIYLGGICLCLLMFRLYRLRQEKRLKTA